MPATKQQIRQIIADNNLNSVVIQHGGSQVAPEKRYFVQKQ